MSNRKQSLFPRFWSGYLRPHLWGILLALVLMIVEGSALGGLSYLLKPLFDVVFSPGGEVALYGVGFGILGLFTTRAFTVVASRTLIWVRDHLGFGTSIPYSPRMPVKSSRPSSATR